MEQDILSDIRVAYLGSDMNESPCPQMKPNPGRVLIIVKDDYAARQIADYITSLNHNYNTGMYEYPCNDGVSSQEIFSPVMLNKMKLFVTKQCDGIRRQLKNNTLSVSSLPIERQMLLCLEEELYCNSSSSGGETLLGGMFAVGSTTCDISGPAAKKQRIDKISTGADDGDSKFVGMRCVSLDERTTTVLEHPSVSSVEKPHGVAESTLLEKSRLHMMILTHAQVRHRVNCFSELLPSHVIVMDADLLVIRQLEVYSAVSGNNLQVCECCVPSFGMCRNRTMNRFSSPCTTKASKSRDMRRPLLARKRPLKI